MLLSFHPSYTLLPEIEMHVQSSGPWPRMLNLFLAVSAMGMVQNHLEGLDPHLYSAAGDFVVSQARFLRPCVPVYRSCFMIRFFFVLSGVLTFWTDSGCKFSLDDVVILPSKLAYRNMLFKMGVRMFFTLDLMTMMIIIIVICWIWWFKKLMIHGLHFYVQKTFI